MIIRRVRSGAGLEDAAMRDLGVVSTPLPFTPAAAPMTPMPVHQRTLAPAADAEVIKGEAAVAAAVAEAVEVEELQSVKEEQLDLSMMEQAADDISLFPVEVVSAGVVQIDSSSGSDDESSSTSSDTSSISEAEPDAKRARFSEDVPEGFEFFRHCKSGIVHKCAVSQNLSQCKITMSSNYRKLERRVFVNHPKCLRCFPKDHNRIGDVDQLTRSLDGFLKSRAQDRHTMFQTLAIPKGGVCGKKKHELTARAVLLWKATRTRKAGT